MLKRIMTTTVMVMAVSLSVTAKDFVLGFSPKAMVSPFWIRMTESVEKTAKENDITLRIVAPPSESDVMQQMNMIEDLTQQKVDLIAVGPTDPQGLIPTFQKTIDQGIPVVIMETQTPLPGVDSISVIGSDNTVAGRMVGQEAVRLLNGKGNVVLIEGIPGNNTGEERKAGFLEIIKANPGLKLVAAQTANWERALAMNVMENILQSNPNVDFVFACSDEMALGSAMALEAVGKHIPVFGVDGNKEAVVAVKEGRLAGTIAQSPEKMGELLVTQVAVPLSQGKPVKPVLTTNFEMIDKSNCDQFLK